MLEGVPIEYEVVELIQPTYFGETYVINIKDEKVQN